ncbi:MAG: patatin family protein [Bacilli bacterium]|jgi:predicted patatin/cPLA2 family phospholipase|nr:patatin family protein [Bacilli bacterium]MCH4210152.1 patatin family protein [Bacilli bacterium]MCH4228898.1 patatin family protein [Bacilli bacterium]
MSKIAVCIQGGGSRGLYSAEPLDLLNENGIVPTEVFGTSCGSIMGLNYVSGDLKRNRAMALILSSDKDYFNPFDIFSKKKTMFDYDHLIFELGKSKDLPFSFDKFASNPAKFYAVVSSCVDGKTHYLEKNEKSFLPGAIAASAALPLTSYPVYVDGVPYLDGGITCPIGYKKAMEDGCDKIIVIATRARGYRKGNMKTIQWRLVKRMYHDFPVWLKSYERNCEIYNEEMDELDKLVDEGKIFCLYPSIPPSVGHAEKDAEKLNVLMDQGKNDALSALPRLKEYLSK